MKRKFDDLEENNDFLKDKRVVRDNKVADDEYIFDSSDEDDEWDEDTFDSDEDDEREDDEWDEDIIYHDEEDNEVTNYSDRPHVIVIIEDSFIRYGDGEGVCPLQQLLMKKFTEQTKLFKQWYTDMLDFIDRVPVYIPFEYSTILRKARPPQVSTSPLLVLEETPTIESWEISNDPSEEVQEKLVDFDINNPSLVNDKDWVLNAVQKDSRVYKFASNKVKLEKEIVFKTLERDVSLFEYLPRILRFDKEIVKFALQYDGDVLSITSSELRNDNELVSMSLKHTVKALDYYIWDREEDYLLLVEEALNTKSLNQLKGIKLTNDQACKLARKYPNVITLGQYAYQYDKEVICDFLKQDENFKRLPNANYHLSLVLDNAELMQPLLKRDDFIGMFKKILFPYYFNNDILVFYDILKTYSKLSLYDLSEFNMNVRMLSYLPIEEQQTLKTNIMFETFQNTCTLDLDPVPSRKKLERSFELQYPGLVVPYSMFEISPTERDFFKLCLLEIKKH